MIRVRSVGRQLEAAGHRHQHVERDVVVHVRAAHGARLQRDLQHAHARVVDEDDEVDPRVGIALAADALCPPPRPAAACRGAWPAAALESRACARAFAGKTALMSDCQ